MVDKRGNFENIAKDLNVEVKDVLHMEKRLSANDTPFDAPSDTSDSDDQIMSPSQYLEDSAANPALTSLKPSKQWNFIMMNC